MAYEKQTWANGDVITQEKLNHIEDGIAGAGEKGYECVEERALLLDETVTLSVQDDYDFGPINYSGEISYPVIYVTFDGVEYTCPNHGEGGNSFYGANSIFDFETIPFLIVNPDGNQCLVYTKSGASPSVHTIRIMYDENTVTTTPCFEKAVKSIVNTGYECTETTEQLFSETVTTEEIGEAYIATLQYSDAINADVLTIVFDGTEYVCPKIIVGNTVYYGGVDPNTGKPDFTNYPFAIINDDGANVIVTESSITATIIASAPSITVETTGCFEKAACESAVCILTVNTKIEGTNTVLSLNKTWQEIYDIAKTKMVLLRTYEPGRISFAPLVMMDSDYRVEFGSEVFVADSADGYPTSGGAN